MDENKIKSVKRFMICGCDAKFTNEADLKNHFRLVHQEDKEVKVLIQEIKVKPREDTKPVVYAVKTNPIIQYNKTSKSEATSSEHLRGKVMILNRVAVDKNKKINILPKNEQIATVHNIAPMNKVQKTAKPLRIIKIVPMHEHLRSNVKLGNLQVKSLSSVSKTGMVIAKQEGNEVLNVQDGNGALNVKKNMKVLKLRQLITKPTQGMVISNTPAIKTSTPRYVIINNKAAKIKCESECQTIGPITDSKDSINCDNSYVNTCEEATEYKVDSQDMTKSSFDYEDGNEKTIKKEGNEKVIIEEIYEESKYGNSTETEERDGQEGTSVTTVTNTEMVAVDQIFFFCEKCGWTSDTERDLHNHQSRHRKTKSKKPEKDPDAQYHKCHLCDKEYQSIRSLSLHLTKTHGTKNQLKNTNKEKKRFVCEECGKIYMNRFLLSYHIRTHTGERPFLCDYCPKGFTTKFFLKLHTRTHTGERPYPCNECDKRFIGQSALWRHRKVHTQHKPYMCTECGKCFSQSNSMKLHIMTVHLKQPAPYKSQRRKAKEKKEPPLPVIEARTTSESPDFSMEGVSSQVEVEYQEIA